MPVSGGKYVAPVWQNGGPPALDADELNAISQSIMRNQGDIGDLNTLTQQLSAAVGGAAKVEVGSYVGTGTYGSENPNVIDISLNPVALFVYDNGPSGLMMAFKGTGYYQITLGSINRKHPVSFCDGSISWYSIEKTTGTTREGHQLNMSGETYSYLVVGV